MYLLIVILLALPAAAWRGYVAGILWTWFLTPVFGVPAPGIWTMAGIALLISMLTSANGYVYDPRPENEKIFGSIVIAIIGPPLVLFFAWAYTLLGG